MDIKSTVTAFLKNKTLVRKILAIALSATGVIMLLFFSIIQLPIFTDSGKPIELNLWSIVFQGERIKMMLNREMFFFVIACTLVELAISGALLYFNIKFYSERSESILFHGLTVLGALVCAGLYLLQAGVISGYFNEIGAFPPEGSAFPSTAFLAMIYALLMAGLLFYFALPKCKKCGKLDWSEFTALDDDMLCSDCQIAERNSRTYF